jgi:GrpB-like predicted nucleotidyltransferase (UPF0157 family)
LLSKYPRHTTTHLDFWDYLIAYPEEARRYTDLKKKLAHKFPHDILGYIAGKDTFINETIQKAHEWRKQQIDSDRE